MLSGLRTLRTSGWFASTLPCSSPTGSADGLVTGTDPGRAPPRDVSSTRSHCDYPRRDRRSSPAMLFAPSALPRRTRTTRSARSGPGSASSAPSGRAAGADRNRVGRGRRRHRGFHLRDRGCEPAARPQRAAPAILTPRRAQSGRQAHRRQRPERSARGARGAGSGWRAVRRLRPPSLPFERRRS
jgi:hypothetical protein